jgi:hypothetical protein
MALALPLIVAVPLGFLLGGRLRSLADFRLRATWLFFGAIALQIAAFPFGALPWRTGETAATLLWIASYALLIAGAFVNRRVTGVPLVGAGMALNLLAIAANGGTMPVLPSAMRAAGDDYVSYANSTAVAHPHLSWLVDRWAAPGWIVGANVYSVGDLLMALGGFLFPLFATGVRPLRLLGSLRGRASTRAA